MADELPYGFTEEEAAASPALEPAAAVASAHETEPTISCNRCQGLMSASASFCPSCGAERTVLIRARRAEDRREAERGWNAVRDTIAFYVILLAAVIPLAWIPEAEHATAQLILAGVQALIIVVVIIRWKLPVWPLLKVNRSVLSYLPITIALLLGLLVVNLGYHQLIATFFQGIDDYQYSEAFNDGGYRVWVQFYAIALMPAIWEELAFRGLIQERLQQLLSAREALILTAVLFGIIHCAFWSTPILILIGLSLGWLRLKSGSLLPGMLLHGLHNACILGLEYL